MTHTTRPHHDRSNHRGRRAALPLIVLLSAAALLAGCGSSSSTSQPTYCSAVSDLEDSVNNLPSADDVKNNGVSALKSALTQVQHDAGTVVNEAQSAFSSQTTAVKTSVDTLSTNVNQIANTPTPQAIAQLPAQISSVTTSTKDLQSAVSSECA